MPPLGIDGEPFAKARAPPAQEITGGWGGSLFQHACFSQYKGHGAGTIVCGVYVAVVASTQAVWLADNFVACRDSTLDTPRRMGRRDGSPITQNGGVPLAVHVRRRAGVLLQLLLLLAPIQQQERTCSQKYVKNVLHVLASAHMVTIHGAFDKEKVS